jgi:hypothetical protein
MEKRTQNEPKNEPGHVVEKKESKKFRPEEPVLMISPCKVRTPKAKMPALLPLKAVPDRGRPKEARTPEPLQAGRPGAILLCPF